MYTHYTLENLIIWRTYWTFTIRLVQKSSTIPIYPIYQTQSSFTNFWTMQSYNYTSLPFNKKKIYPQICQFQRRTNYSFVAVNSLSQHERKNSCIKLWLLPLLDTYPFAPSFWNILMTYSLSRSFSFPANHDLSCSIIPLLHDMDIYFGKIPSRKCIKNLIKF